MRKKENRHLTCIDNHCFANDYDAGKYLLQMACEHKRVKIRQVEIG